MSTHHQVYTNLSFATVFEIKITEDGAVKKRPTIRSDFYYELHKLNFYHDRNELISNKPEKYMQKMCPDVFPN